MRCAQVNPESAVPSSHEGSHVRPVLPNHSVSQAGLVQPDNGVVGAPL